jgi:ribosomal-protein-alanine N-acetyltransferase
MNQSEIETPRLLLRPLMKQDAGDVQALAGNENVSQTTLNIPHPYKTSTAVKWISTHADAWKNRTGVTCAIVEKSSNDLVGVVSLVNIVDGNAELGYWIGEPYWNRGYCSEAAKSLVQFAFEKLAVKNIVAEHLSSNPASGRVMQKLGMQHLSQTQKPNRYGKLALIELYELRKR